jgi:6-phosphogluconolactonase (cycloisomerase 2 family)
MSSLRFLFSFICSWFLVSGCGALTAEITDTSSVVPLRINTVSPSEVFLAGGIPLTISGTGFDNTVSVKIGDADCESASVVSANEITCLTPPKGLGLYDMTLTKGEETATYSNALNYKIGAYLRTKSLAGGTAGRGSADGTGSAARFMGPYGITSDGTHLFVADTNNHTIRKIVIATGVVTTLAGTAGSSGSTDATGLAAKFSRPSGITIDGPHLFVADTYNHTIRKIVIATGVVTTLAGTAGSSGSTDGTGSAAKFDNPYGITSDGTHLFVPDSNNHTIRKIVIATGVVTTLAGTAGSSGSTDATGSAARFKGPFGIIRDGPHLFVADTNNHTIRKIVIDTGVVTTLAGTAGSSGSTDDTGSAARFNRPDGITSDGTHLFVMDRSNHTIRKIVIATGVVTTLAGTAGSFGSTDATGSAARFYNPSRVTSDGTHLFVADRSNHTIRKIVIDTGVVTTLAGTAGSFGSTDATGSAARFYIPGGITSDGTHLFVADTYNHTIRKIVIATGVVTTLAGTAGSSGSTDATGSAARFDGPSGITSDGTHLFVVDTYNHTIRKIVIATGVVTTLAGTAGNVDSTDATGSAARFAWPQAITSDGTHLFVADRSNHTIRKIVIATGVVTTLAGTAGSAGSTDGTGSAARFNWPYDITSDGTHLFVADTYNHTIRKIVIATAVVTTLAGTAGSTGSTDGIGTAARFNNPYGITSDGIHLFVADKENHTIRKIVIATGVVTTALGSPSTGRDTLEELTLQEGTTSSPQKIFYSPQGIFFTTRGGVRKIY